MERVIRVSPLDDYTLELWFSTGDHRLFDMTPYLDWSIFPKLRDLTRFKRAYVAFDTVCWPDNLDIAPETFSTGSPRWGREFILSAGR